MNIIVKKIWSHIKGLVPNAIRQRIKEWDTQEYTIITHPEEIYERVYHIKDASWEPFEMPDIYQVRKELKGSLFHRAQDILLINEECTQAPNSDVICTSKGVVWDKYYEDIFPYMLALDEDVCNSNEDTIRLRKADKEISIEGKCLSLFGTFSTIWSHFLVQFLPKLYYAEEAGLLDKNITVLLPDIQDSHVDYLVNKVLEHHPQLRIIRDHHSDYRKVYRCQELYYIPTASVISNDYVFPSMLHYIIPSRVIEIIREKVVQPEIAKLGHSNVKGRKIYLMRRSFRVPSEIEKIEEFFRNEGFDFVEPHKLGFDEKVKVFNEASIIVGPHSSAWTNLIFTNRPKCLMFLSTNWIDDMYCGYLNINFDYTLLQVAGNTEGKYDRTFDHHNYDLTLEKVKAAYNQLLKM